jgi:hypothetical protein
MSWSAIGSSISSWMCASAPSVRPISANARVISQRKPMSEATAAIPPVTLTGSSRPRRCPATSAIRSSSAQ